MTDIARNLWRGWGNLVYQQTDWQGGGGGGGVGGGEGESSFCIVLGFRSKDVLSVLSTRIRKNVQFNKTFFSGWVGGGGGYNGDV